MNEQSIQNAPLERPLREGANEPHEVFRTRLSDTSDDSSSFTTFLDYGSPACYVSKTLAKKLQTYKSRKPSKLSGIGGNKGPRIDDDVVIRFCWKLKNGWSLPYEVSCGVVADNSFPGDLVLGKSCFHKLDLWFQADGSIQLSSHPGKPILIPFVQKTVAFEATETSFFTTEEVISKLDNVPSHFHSIIATWNQEFPGVFDPEKRNTADKATVMHRIDTGDAVPIKQSPRRYSPAQEEAMREFVKTHEGSIIQKSKSSWASPALLTPKKSADGAPKRVWNKKTKQWDVVWRFCCDFRALNSATKKHAHPLPNADAEIERAAGHKYYCFLDLLNGFWHIITHPNDREKTAFVTPFGIYEWLVMPFGLCNAPATFQSFVEEVLGPLREFLAGLLDDIAIWADTIEELKERVHKVLERLNEYGLVLNIPKCRWFVTEGTFLGFKISEAGIRADPAKVAAIRERPAPKTATEIRSFLNAAGYLRRLIDHFSTKAGPLYALIGGAKNQNITLNEEQFKAWETIRDIASLLLR